MGERKHVSEEERKRGFLIFILIGVLVAIALIIIIMFIPKGNKDDLNGANQSQLTSSKNSSDKDKILTNETKNTDKTSRDKSKVTIAIKTGTLTIDGAVIVITDTNENQYSWTPRYRLQQLIGNSWEDMELKSPENAFFSDTETPNETGVMEQSLVWSNKYGQLEVGQYRIVKESDGNEFYAEFEVK